MLQVSRWLVLQIDGDDFALKAACFAAIRARYAQGHLADEEREEQVREWIAEW